MRLVGSPLRKYWNEGTLQEHGRTVSEWQPGDSFGNFFQAVFCCMQQIGK
jgi:hypothetical protein